jgi:very-short-patch-repair endonuclease
MNYPRLGERAPTGVVEAARRQRKEMTEAENVLWAAIRRRQVAGLRFRKQHPIGPFILDFYCHERKLAIEVVGGIHSEPIVQERDHARTKSLNEAHITVLRVTNDEVLHHLDTVLSRISAASPGDSNPP